MITLLEELWEWFLVLWRTGNLWGRVLILPIIAIFLWPVVLFVGALVAPSGIVAVAALVVPIAGLCGLFFAYPVVTGLVLGVAANGGQAARRLFKSLFVLTGAELLIGTYLVFVPVREDPGLLAMITLALVAFVFVAPAGARKITTRVVVAILPIVVVIGTISFFFGGRDGVGDAVNELNERASNAFVGEDSGSEEITLEVKLLGEDRLSEPVDFRASIPPCWDYWISAPAGINPVVHFEDGTTGLIYGPGGVPTNFGFRGGKVRFTGPEGFVVRIVAAPMGSC